MIRISMRPCLALTLLALLALTAGGCWNPFDPLTRGVAASRPAPIASSPEGVLRRFEWAYNNRSIEVYRELFTADYRFVFAALDTNGNAYRDRPFTRDDDIESTTNLFLGGHATEPAASAIQLALASSFSVFNDPRPGKHPAFHKNIRSTVSLQITTTDGDLTTVEGTANFFLVHEDSANIPLELQDRVAQDPGTTWFIERWEDETYQPGSALAPPVTGRAPAGTLASMRRDGPSAASGTRSFGFVKRVFWLLSRP
jgi:hypothetical protein